MPLNNTFTPAAYANMPVGPVSSNVVLPSGTDLVITNLGPSAVVVLLTTSSSATVTPSTGMAIPAGAQSLPLVITPNTHIAAMTVGDGGAGFANLNLVAGS